MRRSVGRVLAVAGMGMALSAAWASPASAHTTWIFHGSNVGVVWSGHDGVTIGDRECDGITARIEYTVSTIGGTVRYSLSDPNGCTNGDGTRSHYPQRVLQARVCEGSNCTGWYNVN